MDNQDIFNDKLQEYYSNPENVAIDISQVRKGWSLSVTDLEAQQMFKTLMLCYIYCPEECEMPVLATLDEFEIRMQYLQVNYLLEGDNPLYDMTNEKRGTR